MSQPFNYEEIFMGVHATKPKSYLRTFKQDYRLKRLKEALKITKGRMLDIGCGGGVVTESLPYYYPQVSVYGCDVSRTAITYARKFGSGKVKYAALVGKKFPFRDNFFDACICLDVMEHVPDVNFFLKEVKRILKKNGKFFLLVPCEGEPLTFTWFFQKVKLGKMLTFKHWGHIHPEFTHKRVERLMASKGFSIISKTYSEHWLYQLINLTMYFLPKEILVLILGKNKTSQYADRSLISAAIHGKNQKDLLSLLRDVWLGLTGILGYLRNWETETFKNVSFGAWKLHLLAVKHK